MCSPASLIPFTSSSIAAGWSPFGSNSETILSGTPPSLFSGRGGRCGTQVWSRNSGRPFSIRSESACTVAVTAPCGVASASSSVTSRPATGISPAPARSLRRGAAAHRRAARGLERLFVARFSSPGDASPAQAGASGRKASGRRAPSPGAWASPSRSLEIASAHAETGPDGSGRPSRRACGASEKPSVPRSLARPDRPESVGFCGISAIWDAPREMARRLDRGSRMLLTIRVMPPGVVPSAGGRHDRM